MLEKIGIRIHNTHALRAGLHGVKIPIKGRVKSGKAPVVDWSEKQNQAAEKAHEAAVKRMQARYRKRKT